MTREKEKGMAQSALIRILSDAVDRSRGGSVPAASEYTRRHPDLREEIEAQLRIVEMLDASPPLEPAARETAAVTCQGRKSDIPARTRTRRPAADRASTDEAGPQSTGLPPSPSSRRVATRRKPRR
jgi:hypothetical protein